MISYDSKIEMEDFTVSKAVFLFESKIINQLVSFIKSLKHDKYMIKKLYTIQIN